MSAGDLPRRAAEFEHLSLQILQEVTKTAYEWDADPLDGVRVVSWADFGRNCAADGVTVATRITWEEFVRYRRGVTVVNVRSMLDAPEQSGGPTGGQ